MKRIRSCTVLGKRWRVLWKKYLGHDKAGTEYLGRCCHDRLEIHIKAGMSAQLTAEVLAHEIGHAQNPKHSEESVDQDASDLITALDRAGLITEGDE